VTAQRNAIIKANDSMEEGGKAVMTQVNIVGRTLVASSIGDAPVFVLRRQPDGEVRCINVTKEMRTGYNFAEPHGQIAGEKEGLLSTIRSMAFQLQEGDMILLGSDGLGDPFEQWSKGSVEQLKRRTSKHRWC